jgi:hypothetical protein
LAPQTWYLFPELNSALPFMFPPLIIALHHLLKISSFLTLPQHLVSRS